VVAAVRCGCRCGSLFVFVVVVEVMAFGRCGLIRRRWVDRGGGGSSSSSRRWTRSVMP
jgi:hypothetical protein